ncbi:DUF1850 domain-containing protein [uncultured Rhodospira sp.]|uniref:DUF1850 domain-containing protein n=1 Tax=uncultured Rhodospira sp. TaxID=1936189 RepID=UPI002614EB4D|nr:DUF1850 domain-containing protein [uncultured Rhodospira sp.]
MIAAPAVLVVPVLMVASPESSAGERVVDQLEAVTADGRRVAALAVARGRGWCLHWNHSVTGDPVVDCYVNDGGRMTLSHAIQPDFAAGLGHVPGRGVFRAGPDGTYLIDAIDEPVPGNAYVLRVGSAAVDHRLVTDDGRIARLSAVAAGTRVILRLRPEGASEEARP